MAGLTLVFHALFGINPTYTGYLFNLPLLLFGIYFFGRKMMVYTIYGTTLMYFFVYIFQKIPLYIDLQHDYLVVALVAGICAGIGNGIVFVMGGLPVVQILLLVLWRISMVFNWVRLY